MIVASGLAFGVTGQNYPDEIHSQHPDETRKTWMSNNDNGTFTNLADSSVLVYWKKSLRAVPASHELARGHASHFKVVDKGNGQITLRSEIGRGFVAVLGVGRIGEVRCAWRRMIGGKPPSSNRRACSMVT